ncbi:conjugal transfer protein [Enterobacter hormaechei]|nr:conjugal transfer protein [Enterobacter hormaechei]ELD3190780.1 conjugal transfer protein [Enterobacter hormaechei]
MLNRISCAVTARVIMLSETLRGLFLRVLAAWFALISPVAMAAGDFADIGNNLATGATSGTKSALTLATFGGVCTVIGSLFALKSMKNNPQVKPWMVAMAFVVGILLIVIPELIKRGQTQMGMTPVSVG